MSMDTFDLHNTAIFLESCARHIANEARKCTGLLPSAVDDTVRSLYARAKTLHDMKAEKNGREHPATTEPGPRVKTNVGDPNPHGKGGGAKKR
jgi:hypothetical protein